MVEVAGIVTHRQQPDTAKGVVFVNLEDETGLLNVICTADVWRRFRKVARMSPALVVRGMLERYQGVINVVAARIEELPLTAADMVRSATSTSRASSLSRSTHRPVAAQCPSLR